MIHIDFPNGQTPPDDWVEKAKALTKQLEDATDQKQRERIIDENSAFWGEIKDWLESFSHGKCWFSEARDVCSYWHVEHFRPKKQAKDPDREGYWWLSFSYKNYRLCGGVVNVKKGAYFPLMPGTKPAMCPHDNCDDESYLLIDPVKRADVDLLTFGDGGMAMPAESEGWGRERAAKSIERYKLNDHVPMRRAREIVWNRCKNIIFELEDQIYKRKQADDAGRPSPTTKERIERLRQDLCELVQPSTPFSGVARACLLSDPRPWVQKCALV